MSISIKTRQAYAEIDSFLELLSEGQRNQVPQKLREFFKREKAQGYKKSIYPDIPIKDQNFAKETLGLIALLNLEYWCKDEQEKQRLEEIYEKNEKDYQNNLNQQFNYITSVRRENETQDIPEENTHMVVVKETALKKFFNRILKFFHNQKFWRNHD